MVTAAILAGGHATRLGGADKSALVVGGETILTRVLRQLESVTSQVVLVGGAVRGSHASGLPIVPDRYANAGPLAGIHAALAEAPSSHVLVLACDLPFVTAPFLTHLTRLRQSRACRRRLPRRRPAARDRPARRHRRAPGRRRRPAGIRPADGTAHQREHPRRLPSGRRRAVRRRPAESVTAALASAQMPMLVHRHAGTPAFNHR